MSEAKRGIHLLTYRYDPVRSFSSGVCTLCIFFNNCFFFVTQPVGIYRGKYEWANENSPVGGDCSLWVRAATLQLDDGQWQCQVTASNYDVQVNRGLRS